MDKNLTINSKVAKLLLSDNEYKLFIKTLLRYYFFVNDEYKESNNSKFLDLKHYLAVVINKQINNYTTFQIENEKLFLQIFGVNEPVIKLLSNIKKILPEKLSEDIRSNIEIRFDFIEETLLEHDNMIKQLNKKFEDSDKKYKDTYEYAVEIVLNFFKKYEREPTLENLEKFSDTQTNGKISVSEWSRNLKDPILLGILNRESDKLRKRLKNESLKDLILSYCLRLETECNKFWREYSMRNFGENDVDEIEEYILNKSKVEEFFIDNYHDKSEGE